MIVGFMVSP